MTERAYQVVVSFRLKPHPGVTSDMVRRGLTDVVANDFDETEGYVTALDVAVREIGAGGESSVMEGEGP